MRILETYQDMDTETRYYLFKVMYSLTGICPMRAFANHVDLFMPELM